MTILQPFRSTSGRLLVTGHPAAAGRHGVYKIFAMIVTGLFCYSRLSQDGPNLLDLWPVLNRKGPDTIRHLT